MGKDPLFQLWGKIPVRAASISVNAWVDKRKITFWAIVPAARASIDASPKTIQDTAKAVVQTAKGIYGGRDDLAHEVASSVSQGIFVTSPTGSEKIMVFEEFWKEGPDRTREDIELLKDALRRGVRAIGPLP